VTWRSASISLLLYAAAPRVKLHASAYHWLNAWTPASRKRGRDVADNTGSTVCMPLAVSTHLCWTALYRTPYFTRRLCRATQRDDALCGAFVNIRALRGSLSRLPCAAARTASARVASRRVSATQRASATLLLPARTRWLHAAALYDIALTLRANVLFSRTVNNIGVNITMYYDARQRWLASRSVRCRSYRITAVSDAAMPTRLA